MRGNRGTPRQQLALLARAWLLLAGLWVVLFAVAVALYKNGKAPSWDIGILRTLTWVVVGSGILVLVRWRQARSQPPESN
jgi:hypothetical protein